MGDAAAPPSDEGVHPKTESTATTTASVARSNAPPAITSTKMQSPEKQQQMTTKATTISGKKHPPKQSEEDMKRVAEIARKRKEEWVKTNKDREFAHKSRTRSVEAYEKLEQVMNILFNSPLLDPILLVVVVVVVVVVCGSIFLSFMWKAFALKRHFYSR
jgi:cobalamin biosynthesis Mg chelatase CobN|tara:strand:+ start:5094 stop:5573 length:480 start_codon:yes stop_codon:yes gene_type:complete